MIIELTDGKQIIVSVDPRAEGVWLQLQANGGSLGVRLSKAQATALSKRLWYDAQKD